MGLVSKMQGRMVTCLLMQKSHAWFLALNFLAMLFVSLVGFFSELGTTHVLIVILLGPGGRMVTACNMVANATGTCEIPRHLSTYPSCFSFWLLLLSRPRWEIRRTTQAIPPVYASARMNRAVHFNTTYMHHSPELVKLLNRFNWFFLHIINNLLARQGPGHMACVAFIRLALLPPDAGPLTWGIGSTCQWANGTSEEPRPCTIL